MYCIDDRPHRGPLLTATATATATDCFIACDWQVFVLVLGASSSTLAQIKWLLQGRIPGGYNTMNEYGIPDDNFMGSPGMGPASSSYSVLLRSA